MTRLRRRRSLLLAGLAVAGAILGLIGATPGTFMVRRPASEYERVLYYFAQNVGEASLCDHIAWAAYARYSVIFGGGGASYDRSDCYERVAEARYDPSVCWRVRPLLDLDPLSSGYSALSCRRRTRASYHTGIALNDALLIRTFERMGYGIDQMSIYGVMPPAIRLRDVYISLTHKPDAIAQATRLLTSPDNALTADDRRYLSQFAAVAIGDPHWCESIPQTAAIDDSSTPSRDSCYLQLAYNSGDVRLCDRMTPAALEPKVQEAKAHGVRGEIAEQLGLHGDCLRIPKRIGPVHPYGPAIPGDDAQTLRLLAALHVTVPRAHDWTENQKAIYFRDFLFALWPKHAPYPGERAHRAAAREVAEEAAKDVARDLAREQLVVRLTELPAEP
jgi:hypothetical protein